MSLVILVAAKSAIIVVEEAVFERKANIFRDAAHEGGTDTVLARISAKRQAKCRVIIEVVRLVIKIGEIEVGFVVQHKTRGGVYSPIVILRIQNRPGVVGGRRFGIAQHIVKPGLQVKPGPGSPTQVLRKDM